MSLSQAINAPLKVGRTFSEWVWYASNAALNEGEAVCYNWDYGTAASFDGSRLNRVETPSTTNAQWFAGVAARAYSAVSGGQLIEIYKPGSVCNVWSGASTTIGVGLITFDVTSSYEGFFRYEGLEGRGSAIPLQTVDRSSTAGLCQALLLDGPESGGVEVVQLVDNTAFVMMVGGTSLLVGAACTVGSPSEEILDGTIEGLRKKVEIITTAVTSNEASVQIENDDGRQSDGSYDLAAVALGAIGDQITLVWRGAQWILTSNVGGTES